MAELAAPPPAAVPAQSTAEAGVAVGMPEVARA
jgi:hypothetical protein